MCTVIQNSTAHIIRDDLAPETDHSTLLCRTTRRSSSCDRVWYDPCVQTAHPSRTQVQDIDIAGAACIAIVELHMRGGKQENAMTRGLSSIYIYQAVRFRNHQAKPGSETSQETANYLMRWQCHGSSGSNRRGIGPNQVDGTLADALPCCLLVMNLTFVPSALLLVSKNVRVTTHRCLLEMQ